MHHKNRRSSNHFIKTLIKRAPFEAEVTSEPEELPQNSLRYWVYEYHYKDHLSNTRLAFRKQEHEVKIATLEPSRVAEEQQDFDNLVETRSPDRSYNGNYSSRLSAAENKPLGPVAMLRVQRGDSLTLSAFASYQVGSPQGRTWTLAAFVSSLFNQAAPPPPGTETYRNGQYTPYIGLALGASIAAFQPEPGVPNAYLKYIVLEYIVLDQDSNYVYSDVKVISSAAGRSWQELKLHYKVAQDGFVQVFVYNESGQEIFFDDITIRKDPALIVQENHYDPWGMNLVGIEMQGRPDHKFQYNGKEKQEDLNLNWLDYGARMYDSQLGRFMTIDPLADMFGSETPFHYVHNNPMLFVDPKGMAAVYNWETGKYMDGDREVSWDEVQQQYGIGNSNDNEKDKGEANNNSVDVLSTKGRHKSISNAFWGLIGKTIEYADKLVSMEMIDSDTGEIIGSAPNPLFGLFGRGAKGSTIFINGFGRSNFYNEVLLSASIIYKGSTKLGHALSKHVRNPHIWGKLSGPPSTWHNLALKHFDDIMNAPGHFVAVKNKDGIRFLEKMLPDGRGIRLNIDKSFKGFIDPLEQ